MDMADRPADEQPGTQPHAPPQQPYRMALINPRTTISHRLRQYGLRRGLFTALYYLLAVHLPNPGMPGGRLGQWLRRLAARRLLRRCGRHVRINRGAQFGSGAKLELGENSNLGGNCWIMGEVTIGDNVMMGPEVIILAYNHRFDDLSRPMIEQGEATPQPVRIGDDVWIGTRAIILPGVTVGSHSIIGAGAVVSRDVPEWAVVAGNPAKVVRMRNAGRDGTADERPSTMLGAGG